VVGEPGIQGYGGAFAGGGVFLKQKHPEACEYLGGLAGKLGVEEKTGTGRIFGEAMPSLRLRT
jgi:hypothetical protein